MLAVLNLIYLALSVSGGATAKKQPSIKFNISSLIAYLIFKIKLKFNVFI